MAKAGRWLADQHPEITEPGQWTRQTCAAWVAAVDRMNVGDYIQRTFGLSKRAGQPITPRTKAGILTATRTFFRDCQEWEWIPRRFDPAHALATPRSVQALVGPNPRVIADDIWAKLLWAGLNIEARDLPANASGPCYPMELIRAVTLTWLFAGSAATRFPDCGSAASAGSTTAPRSPATPPRCSSKTRSACWTFPHTRPEQRSPNPSIPC
jgi:hypothetical protein